MEELTIRKLLEKYRTWVDKGKVQYLDEDRKRDEVKHILDRLIEIFIKAEKDAYEKNTDISDNLDWYETHTEGRELWDKLVTYALNHIDQTSKGNSRLTEFLTKATEFEELLYGLEEYYRDHTLHSLWVYLIGEYILRELAPNIYRNLNWYLFNDITLEPEKKKYGYSGKLVNYARKNEKNIISKVNEYKDATWCLMALCHDIGYSLEKLHKLNERVKSVLDFFVLPEFKQVGYSLDLEHQYLVSQFLDLMAFDFRITPSENYRNSKLKVEERVLIKCYRDDSTYWRLCRALEKKQHGILSAYLIYKILGIFADTHIRGIGDEWGLEDDEAKDNIIRGDILYGIAQHGFDFAHLNQMSSLSDILMIADELEEFSRYGRRKLLTRKYLDTLADASIKFEPKPKQDGTVNIEINYNVHPQLKYDRFLKFFHRKAEQLCKIYSLEEIDGKVQYCRIDSIKMTAAHKGQSYYFHMHSDESKTNGHLPKANIKDPKPELETDMKSGKLDEGDYSLVCHDDKIHVLLKNGEEILLDKWLGIEDKK